MKRKNNPPLTTNTLKEILKAYPTEEKLKEILKTYPTKQELNEQLFQSFEAFRKEQNFQDAQMEERLQEYICTFSNKILTAIDPLLKERVTKLEHQ